MEDLDQIADYGRDIREYHFESRNKKVIPILERKGYQILYADTERDLPWYTAQEDYIDY